MTCADDCHTRLDTYWNSGVTSKPSIVNADRLKNLEGVEPKYKNAVLIYTLPQEYSEWSNLQREMVDETYNIGVKVTSSESEGKAENMESEVKRILAVTGLSGYVNRFLEGTWRDEGNSVETNIFIKFKFKKLNIGL